MTFTREEINYLRKKKINPKWFEKTYEQVKMIFGDDAKITSAELHERKRSE